MNKPPEIISYYTMRRAVGVLGITLPLILVAGYLGCIFVQGVAFLPCSIGTPVQPCLLTPPVQNPLVGELHKLSAFL